MSDNGGETEKFEQLRAGDGGKDDWFEDGELLAARNDEEKSSVGRTNDVAGSISPVKRLGEPC